jgi:hypothetical protein
MYIGYLNDRKELGFSCIKDIHAAKLILNLKKFLKKTKRVSVSYLIENGKQVCILIFSKEVLVAVFIFLKSSYIEPNVDHPSFVSSEVYESCVIKSDNLRFLTSPPQISDFILKLKGGSDEFTIEEQEKLVKSILAKAPQSSYQEISINKFLEKILKLIDPVISNQRFWRVLSELEKPHKFNMIQPTNQSTSSNRPKGFEKVTDDFESRLTKQKVLNEHDSKLSGLHAEHRKRVNRFNRMLQFLNPRPSRDVNLSKSGLPHKKTASVIKQEKIGSNVNSLGRSEWRSPILGMREKIIVSAAPSSSESNITPTADLFSADSVTGDIQNINIAFNQFEQRMTQIGNQYTDEKQEYFFEQLNQCEIDRFKALSTERGRITIYGVREAETMLQSEFEGFHEPNSITRPTNEEYQENNVFDGRFRKGLLSGESNTLNEQYTEADAKLLVSDKTLQDQADERRRLGQKNTNKMSMYEQGKAMGSSIVGQKYKHCNPNKPELTSSPDNVKHIVNALELIPSETEIAKAGVLDGARIAWSEKLNVPESSISDQTALQGIIFLNEDCTIERVN